MPEQEKLQRINKFFNLHVYYDEDKKIWQKADYWATPLETLARARGDCEDFTIAKYISLRLLDIPANKLKLTYVNLYPVIGDNSEKQAHMVLAYYPDEQSDPLILDNLQGKILPASKRPELKPVFSFNDSTMWINGQQSDVKPQLRLSRWRDVLNRMHDDGL
nr:transglutaminase-like cysteine peptidase [Pontibacterium sinense]